MRDLLIGSTVLAQTFAFFGALYCGHRKDYQQSVHWLLVAIYMKLLLEGLRP